MARCKICGQAVTSGVVVHPECLSGCKADDGAGDIVRMLRRLAVERRPEACLGCGYEHGCSVHGCAVIKRAVEMVKSNLHENELGKTADEMFRELGYEKERDNEFQTVYKNHAHEIIVAKDRNVVFSTYDDRIVGIACEELRAVCKLLDEMGVE